jgi:prophage maintenance system killer protein
MGNQIEIFRTENNQTEIQVLFENDSVWLSQKQMSQLFQSSIPNINMHIKSIYDEEELTEFGTIQDFLIVQKEGNRDVQRRQKIYNLDVIISVGYRIKSKQGTQFRQWATQRLKDYLVKGFVLNEKRLLELNYKYTEIQNAIKLASKAGNVESLTSTEAKGILKVIETYAYALETLDKYDHQKLTIDSADSVQKLQKLSYKEAIKQIKIWREFQKAGSLFGNEKDESFKSSLETIYQTFDGIDLYPSLEEKAANLLYFIVKNHSFSDGNKRIAAGLFIYFLDLNNNLYNELGNKRIGDNALVAITIMIAESKADEKDMMIKLVVNLINNNNL